jgi:SpoIID/LytB domain protein
MAIERRKKEWVESVDSMKMYVPKEFGAEQDPPKQDNAYMEQLPKLAQEPIITVGIMHSERIGFFFDSPFRCAELPNITFDGEYEVFYSESGRVLFFEHEFDSLHFMPIEEQDYTSEDGYFELEDVVIGINFHWERKENQRFKGGLTFMVEHGKVVAINEISTEAYIFSVISSEMSATASLELLKAHAVISRSWLLKPIIHNEHNANAVLERRTEDELIKWYERDSHELYNVCADDHCQRYQGITRARTENVRLAIEATRGMVLMNNGEICDARFSKSCGGVSEVFESCWADVHYPYLERVVDSQQTLTPSPSGTPPKSGGEYVGSQTIANSQSNAAQAEKPVVVAAPIVVQRPKVVSVSLKPTVANEATQLPQKEEVATEAVPSIPIVQEAKQNDFSNGDLVRAWRLYAKKIEGELHTSNTMQNFLPAKVDATSVIVKLINTMQLEALTRHKRTLEQFLATELGNSGITMQFVVEEQTEQPIFLTKDENFKRMQEINADFKHLKNELGLELI